jgi:hypothetical protein
MAIATICKPLHRRLKAIAHAYLPRLTREANELFFSLLTSLAWRCNGLRIARPY